MEDADRPWKRAAFSQWPRGGYMGYSMRAGRYRYTEWSPRKDRSKPPLAVELYNHKVDPDENVNIAEHPENEELVAKMSGILRAGWRKALPE
jgi:hypothetical protein